MNHNISLTITFVTFQGVGSEMNDPFEAYRKSKSYSFIGSRIGKYFSQLMQYNNEINTFSIHLFSMIPFQS